MPLRNLGYACQNLSINEGKKNSDKILTDRTCRLANFNLHNANQLILNNSKDLVRIMDWNAKNDIKFFRVSSNIFPFYDHQDLQYKIEDLSDSHEIKSNFSVAGEIARNNGIRLSCHPGPYTCLASPSQDIVNKAIKTIYMHDTIGKMLNSDDFCINFHVGGVYEDKEVTAKRFCENFGLIDESVRNRITLENDDKASMWSITDLYKKIYEKCGVKLVLDIHHHKFRNDESLQEAAQMAFSTWKEGVAKVHYSESAKEKRPQAHSDFIENEIPDLSSSVQYDVMVEAKQKDKALIKYRNAYVHKC
jgi:UV DNA damage endonuclease